MTRFSTPLLFGSATMGSAAALAFGEHVWALPFWNGVSRDPEVQAGLTALFLAACTMASLGVAMLEALRARQRIPAVTSSSTRAASRSVTRS